MTNDEKYMQRALDLAKLGSGKVSPNPLVGCVIVHNNTIIGEGFHQKYGEAHAEVNAINSVKDKNLLSESTVYVTLEPCSHFGKTPPCADLLIKHQVKKVVICNQDSFELVSGKGIKKLQAADIETVTDILPEKGKFINRRFFTFIEKKRPYIILKWAETADGFIAGENFKPIKISNELSHKYVHKFRAEENAIMIGTKTAEIDNPKLNVREWSGENPVRIVIDRNLGLNNSLNIFDNSSKTLIFYDTYSPTPTPPRNGEGLKRKFIKIDFLNLHQEILEELYEQKIQSLFIEGGTTLLQSFIDANLFDEIRIFKSNANLGKGIKSPSLPKGLQLLEKDNFLGDTYEVYFA